MKMERVFELFIEFIFVVICSTVIGTGIGCLAATVYAGYFHLSIGFIGGVASTVFGPVSYYLIVRKYINIKSLGLLVSICTIVSVLLGFAHPYLSLFSIPAILVSGSFIIRLTEMEKIENQKISS